MEHSAESRCVSESSSEAANISVSQVLSTRQDPEIPNTGQKGLIATAPSIENNGSSSFVSGSTSVGTPRPMLAVPPTPNHVDGAGDINEGGSGDVDEGGYEDEGGSSEVSDGDDLKVC